MQDDLVDASQQPHTGMLGLSRVPFGGAEPSSRQDRLPETAGLPLAMAPPAEDKEEAILSGNLSKMPPSSVLQSIALSRMTGMLAVTGEDMQMSVYFDEGNIVHASARDSSGDLSVMELLTFETGKFQFYPDERTTMHSVLRRLENLLVDGAVLLDQTRYLKKAGMKIDSLMVRKHQMIAESEFEQKLRESACSDIARLKQFYLQVDDQTTIFECLRRHPMSAPEWIPILFSLVNGGLVLLMDKPRTMGEKIELEPVHIDRVAIEGALKMLVRPETGIFSSPLMLYFLQQEHVRYEAGGLPFSLIIFEMLFRRPYGLESLSNPVVREIARRIAAVTRSIDLLGHYETFAYALLLPQTDLAGANLVAQRVVDVLRKDSTDGAMAGQTLALAFGVASFPEDGTTVGHIIAGALLAKEQAKQNATPIILWRDMRAS